jgi:hypothetical protein
MRIIGTIPHQTYKVSVFVNDGRWSVHFDNGLLSQIYKFRDGEGVGSLDQAQQWVDEALLAKVQAIFAQMSQNRHEAVGRMEPAGEDEFPKII